MGQDHELASGEMHWRLAFDGTWHLCKSGRVGPTGDVQTACGGLGVQLTTVTMTGQPRRGRICPRCSGARAALVRSRSAERGVEAVTPFTRSGVMRVLIGLEAIDEARKRLDEARRHRRDLPLTAKRGTIDAGAAAVAKAEKRLRNFEQQQRAVENRTRAADVKAAHEMMRAASRQRGSAGRPRGEPPVSVRYVEPSVQPAGLCRKCGEGALLRSEGMCGPCLKRAGRAPCPRCGLWLKVKQVRTHVCRETPTSIRTVSGGAPTLGKRR